MTTPETTSPTAPLPLPARIRIAREALVVGGFALLTVLMTWPWAAWVRDAVPDPGDPYLNSWILWWDWHQTFRDPTGLFHGNVFYPLRYTLAFSEHNYGIALLLFPLFALGATPLTAHGVAMLLGYLFSGYGAFRLARTLTGSTGAAWVAGIAFGFVPYRFLHISHVNYTFTAWVPLLLEAVVLFTRRRTWPRAAWLGAAFLMNGLTCIHWLLLSALPVAACVVLLALREGAERDRAFWVRGSACVGAASVLLLPFLLPYRTASALYGFVRSGEDALAYSAGLEHWLTATPFNRLWRGLGVTPSPDELSLFPGLLPLFLALAALFLVRPSEETPPAAPGRAPRRGVLLALDAISVVALAIALLASSPSGLVIRHGESLLFSATRPHRALTLLGVALLVRFSLAWPTAFGFRGRALGDSLRRTRRPAAFHVGLAFVVLGFFGSLGMKFPFHAALHEFVSPFRSIRAPARWAMMADLGLALLAGLGALALARAVAARWPGQRRLPGAVLVAAGALLLFEQRVAPLPLVRGAADPDEVTRFLARTPMRGGIVDLPTSFPGPYEAMLRAADHGKPLVNGVSGFVPPAVVRLEELLAMRPIPDALLDHLEGIPASYVLVHGSRLRPDERAAYDAFLRRGASAGRLRFAGRFDGRLGNDLWVVTKTEPNAATLPFPWDLEANIAALFGSRRDDSLLGSVDEPAEGAEVLGPLLVRGWARAPGEDLEVTLFLDGERLTPDAYRRVPRPDVGRVLPHLGPVDRCGYAAELADEGRAPGKHSLVAVFRARDGRFRPYHVRTFTWKP